MRFILRYLGPGAPPADDIRRIGELVTIVSQAPRMLLVEVEADALPLQVVSLPHWFAAGETWLEALRR